MKILSIKNFGQYKKLPWDEFVKEENISQNIL